MEEKILNLFFENPGKEFSIREISKYSKIPRATAHRKIIQLKKQGLINKSNSSNENNLFRIKKINYFVEKLFEIGIIDFLVEELNPSCIILFGSIRKGDSVKESDIDLFVESSVKKKLNLSKFEKKIGHKIELFVESDIKKLQENLFNNVLNGIKLYGVFKIK